MTKVIEKFVIPYLFKHPALMLALFIMVFLGVFGYFTVMAAVDKKADTAMVMEMQKDLSYVKGCIDQVLNVLTGKPIDGHHPKSPPSMYFIGQDSNWLAIEYDSCKCGFIVDSTQTRRPWHCYYIDFNGVKKMKTFY